MVEEENMILNVDRALRTYVTGVLLNDEEIEEEALTTLYEYQDHPDFIPAIAATIGSLTPYVMQHITEEDITGLTVLWSQISQAIELEILTGTPDD